MNTTSKLTRSESKTRNVLTDWFAGAPDAAINAQVNELTILAFEWNCAEHCGDPTWRTEKTAEEIINQIHRSKFTNGDAPRVFAAIRRAVEAA